MSLLRFLLLTQFRDGLLSLNIKQLFGMLQKVGQASPSLTPVASPSRHRSPFPGKETALFNRPGVAGAILVTNYLPPEPFKRHHA